MADLRIRPAIAADSEFTFQVKRAGFRDYVEASTGWDEAAELAAHERRFRDLDFYVLELDDASVGIMAVHNSSHLSQLFVLPEFQGQGIGLQAMHWLMAQFSPITLRVLKVNPRARAFYDRLGFKQVGETATHQKLSWSNSQHPPEAHEN